MSHQKDSNSSISYKMITCIGKYLQSIDSFIEYLVFSTLTFSLLMGLDLYQNGGKVIRTFFSAVINAITLADDNNRFISYININYPDSNLHLIPCSQAIPPNYQTVGKIQSKDSCQLVVICNNSPAHVITDCKKYFSSNRDN